MSRGMCCGCYTDFMVGNIWPCLVNIFVRLSKWLSDAKLVRNRRHCTFAFRGF